MESWFATAFPSGARGYPNPDWEKIAAGVEARHPPQEWHAVWCDISRKWIASIHKALPEGYSIRESSRFILLAQVDEPKSIEVLRFLERIDGEIRQSIPALLPDALYGKCPVLVFSSHQHFYEYVSDYIEEDGEFGGIGGVYLNRGYGHFAVPSKDLTSYAWVFSHELCHAYLHHLGLPLWLDEAITAGVQDMVTRTNPYELTRQIVVRHQNYWNEERIAHFWEGNTFYAADEGQELSYHLARFILHSLHRGGNTPREQMEEFFLNARYEDAGQSAALEILGVSLGDCVGSLLGDGEWEPTPFANPLSREPP